MRALKLCVVLRLYECWGQQSPAVCSLRAHHEPWVGLTCVTAVWHRCLQFNLLCSAWGLSLQNRFLSGYSSPCEGAVGLTCDSCSFWKSFAVFRQLLQLQNPHFGLRLCYELFLTVFFCSVQSLMFAHYHVINYSFCKFCILYYSLLFIFTVPKHQAELELRWSLIQYLLSLWPGNFESCCLIL